MKLVAHLISVTVFSIYLVYVLEKKDKEKEIQIVNRKKIRWAPGRWLPFLSKDNCLSESTGH